MGESSTNNGSIKRVLILLSAALLSGCAAHSFPLVNHFVAPVEASCAITSAVGCTADNVVQVFSDTNGTLYPSGWRSYFHPQVSKKHPGEGHWIAGSLLAQSGHRSKFRSLIEHDEQRQLNEISTFSAQHKRIFILVHGFNAPMESTNLPYEMVEADLDLKPSDGVIRFYWDGRVGTGVGALNIWLKAANDSQVVGSRGLREVLNHMQGREVYVIAHSRGASVIMSALGNPVYESKFLTTATNRALRWGKAYGALLSPDALVDQGNSIHIIMLAPAIDRIDFCDASEQPFSSKKFVCKKFRPLGSQVKSFSYTVNSGDPILGKSIFSSQALKPTGLGYRADIGRDLKAENYPLFRAYEFEKPESFHGFKDYIAHPIFMQMLTDAGIAKPQTGK